MSMSGVLKGILKWSLTQHDGEPSLSDPNRSTDPGRLKWLRDALTDISNQPSETDILKAALTILKVHGNTQEADENVKNHLEETFEQIQYLIEDMDHANDMIPLGGIDVISQYLEHKDMDLVQSSCELIATASQNNPRCQEAFHSAIGKLLTLIENPSLKDVRIKALYAVSCLIRDFPLGRSEFFRKNGLRIVIACLTSGVTKLTIKSLFLISYLYTAGSESVLLESVEILITQLICALEQNKDADLLRHTTSLLTTLSRNFPSIVEIKTEKDIIKLLDQKCHELGMQEELKEEIQVLLKSSSLYQTQ